MTPEDVRALTERVYRRCGPQLGCDVQCRTVAVLAAGITEAWNVPAEFVFWPSYTEAGVNTPHFVLRFEDGRVLDGWLGQIRLLRR